ncbi:MAG: nuclear transport factor 2 family protein [Ferruginibacter sp.]
MKRFLLLATVIAFAACQDNKQPAPAIVIDIPKEKTAIGAMLDSFNIAAANADYDKYFSYYTADATFNGTDATENWDKKAFMAWAKPFFDKKTTWNFTALKRNIYFGRHDDIAWFEELLNTQMKICRGSGVVVKEGNEWKVAQYVLSMTIPNDKIDPILTMKTPIEDSLIKVLQAK